MINLKNFSTFFMVGFVPSFLLDYYLFHPGVPILWTLIYATVVGVGFGIFISKQLLKKKVIAKSNLNYVTRKDQLVKPFKSEFSPAIKAQFFVIVFVIAAVFVSIYVWFEDYSITKRFFISFVASVSTIALIYIYKRSRLILNEQGITQLSAFGEIKGKWENIIEIYQLSNNNEIMVFDSVTYTNPWMFIKPSNKEIDISLFEDSWQTGETGKIVRENASHLQFLEKEIDDTENIDVMEVERIETNEYWRKIKNLIRK